MGLMGSAGLGFVYLSELFVRRGRLGSVGGWSRGRLEIFSMVHSPSPPPRLVVSISLFLWSRIIIDYRHNLTFNNR
jgi:hypothetical protein